MKLGLVSLGLVSKTHVVLGGLKRSLHDLSNYQEKVFEIDSHMGITISGLTSDARALAMHMRMECLNYRFAHGAPMITSRLVGQVAEMHQRRTMQSWSRPYGVGLLVAGVDADGPHLFETDPSGVFSEYHAIAIGSRAQSARTYFERHVESFAEASSEELILHALRALQASASDTAVTVDNVSISIIGRAGEAFQILTKEKLEPYVNIVKAERAANPPPREEEEEEEPGQQQQQQQQGGEEGEERMETE